MIVLGVESSCDETGLALYHTERGLLAHALHSQVAMHEEYGGVVPELASRDHVKRAIPLLEKILADSGLSLSAIDAIAYTQGPGLAGALLVGAAIANGLALALAKPVLGVHHLEGHLLSPMLSEKAPEFPFVALLVSGGHTQLMRVGGVGDYTLLGETLDDAAGEAFDKVARIMGLGFPGGPIIDKTAGDGDLSKIQFPRGLSSSTDLLNHKFDFSFSGLKTAVSRYLDKTIDYKKADVAASFQEAVVDVLITKSLSACKESGIDCLVIAGGVAANSRLRQLAGERCDAAGIKLSIPPIQLCTDNGAMVAALGSLAINQGANPSQIGISADSAATFSQIIW